VLHLSHLRDQIGPGKQAWVSMAAGTKDGKLPAAVCSEVASGGGRPDVLIASDLPLQGFNGAGPRQLVDAIRAGAPKPWLPGGQVGRRLPVLR